MDTKLVFLGLLAVALVSAVPTPVDNHVARKSKELMGAVPPPTSQKSPPRSAVSPIIRKQSIEDMKEKMKKKAEEAKDAATMVGGMAKSKAEEMKDQVTQMG